MKSYSLLLAILALAAPQIGAIEPDNCAELAEQLRDEQAKIEQLEKEKTALYFDKINLERNASLEIDHNFDMTRAFKVATVASAISGAGFAVAKTFAPHLDHVCPKALAGVLGIYVSIMGGVFSLLGVPDLVNNSLDSRRPAVERFGSLCAALVGIAPAAVAAYMVGSMLPACS